MSDKMDAKYLRDAHKRHNTAIPDKDKFPPSCDECTEGIRYSEQYHMGCHIPEVISEPCSCPRGDYEYNKWVARAKGLTNDNSTD